MKALLATCALMFSPFCVQSSRSKPPCFTTRAHFCTSQKGENMKALLATCALAVAFGTGSTATAQSYPPNGSTIPAVILNGSPAIQQPAPNSANQQSAWNTELAGHSDLQGR